MMYLRKTRRLFLGIVAINIVVLFLIAFVELFWQSNTHGFDPFLQNPPQVQPAGTFKLKAEGKKRILLLGGSTTYWQQKGPEFHYPYYLQKLSGPDVEVITLARDWYTTKHSLILYETLGRQFNPDVVIIMHAINDMYRSCQSDRYAIGPYKDDWSHYYGPSIQGALQKSLIHKGWDRFKEIWDYPKAVHKNLEFFQSYDPYLKHYERLIQNITRDGIQVIMLTQPYFYSHQMDSKDKDLLWFMRRFCSSNGEYPDEQSAQKALELFNLGAKNLANDQGIKVIDLEKIIPKTKEYFFDDVHLHPKGAKKEAQEIARVLFGIKEKN